MRTVEETTKQNAEVGPSDDLSRSEVSLEGRVPLGRALIEILLQLANRKRLIAILTGTSFLIGVAISFLIPVRYTAVAKIMPPRQTPSATMLMSSQLGAGALADLGGSGGLFRDPNAMYIGVLQSRPIGDSIITKFGLLTEYHAKDMSGARKRLQVNTSITSERSTLIAVYVSDHDKKRAADMANAYVDNLRVLTRSVAITEASKRRAFFEDQLKAQKDALIGAEVAFQNLQQSKGLVRLDTQSQSILSRLGGLQNQIVAKEVELEALRSYSTEENSQVQLAERELSAMKEEAAQLEQHTGPSGYSNLSLKDLPKAGLDYVRAQRELLYQQSLFDILLKQYEAARLDEAKDAIVIQVVEPAVAPDRKSAPNRRIIVILSTFLGFAGGCILALLLHWKDLALSDPQGADAYQRLRRALRGTGKEDLNRMHSISS